jgi:hypothetical protein
MSIKQKYKSSNDIEATATVNTDSDGDVLGVALFLGSDELEDLGLSDADCVSYTVKDGTLQIGVVEDEG